MKVNRKYISDLKAWKIFQTFLPEKKKNIYINNESHNKEIYLVKKIPVKKAIMSSNINIKKLSIGSCQ